MTTIRTATQDDAAAAADMYVNGGSDEAVFSWVIPDEDAKRALVARSQELMVAYLAGAIATGEVVLAIEDEQVVGVAVWERAGEPDAQEQDPAEAAAFFEQAYGEYAPRMMMILEASAARHPQDVPHWYLQQVVVHPEHRGRGIGGALILRHLERVDAEGLPAYLEASTRRNQALYERLGFQPLGDLIVVADDAPRLQPMWREKR